MKTSFFRPVVLGLSVVFLLSACGGGGDDSSTTDNGSNQSQISGTVQADPNDSSASGQNSGATVYVIGQQDSAVQTDSNGNFNLPVDATLSGTVLSSPSVKHAATGAKTFGLVVFKAGTDIIDVNSPELPHAAATSGAGQAHGRKVEVSVTEGQTNTVPTIYINTVGSISGKARLQNASDHAGITVYIPGTSFSAITAADGSYTIAGVPSGTYDFLRAEKMGSTYHYAVLSNITVNTNAQTQAQDMTLQLSTGPNGSVLINAGSAYTTSNTVELSIAASNGAVLMQLSEDPNLAGAEWEPVQATKKFTFTGNFASGGTATVHAKFAEASGLESSPVSASIYIDTNPIASHVSPVSSTNNTKPTLDWDYPHPIPNPKYHVQLASDLGFAASGMIKEATGLTTSEYTLGTPLATGTYYWRVAISDENGKEWSWSYPWSFRVDLSTVGIVAPVNGSLTNDTTPTFTWNANSNASQYIFVLSKNADLSSSDVTTTVTGITQYTPPALPDATSTTYYWAVTPVDANGVSGTRSDVWSFTLDNTPPAGRMIAGSDQLFNSVTNTGILINDGNAITTSAAVSAVLSAQDVNDVVGWYLSENPSTPAPNAAGWNEVLAQKNVTMTTTLTLNATTSGPRTVYIWFKDRAGNVSSACSGAIEYVRFSTKVIDTGKVGTYSSIATWPSVTYSDRVNISYYDETNGDLKLATNYDGISGALTSEWGTMTRDANNDVGKYSDIEFVSGFIRIMYYDKTNNKLIFTRPGAHFYTQPWINIDVNLAGGGGEYASLAQGPAGTYHVSYLYSSATTTGPSQLLYQSGTLSGFNAPETVDSRAGGGRIGLFSSIAAGPTGTVHISYYDKYASVDAFGYPDPVYDLKYATKNDTGIWVTETVDSLGDVGQYTSIAVDSGSNVHISYFDAANKALKYARKDGATGQWTKLTIDKGSVGAYTSLKLDSIGNVHISYFDDVNGDLKYATNAHGGGRWGRDVVDNAGYVGSHSSIAVEVTSDGTVGNVHISYYDAINAALKYAHTY